MTLVEMPKANENLTEATLDRWLVAEGASVVETQPLCEIITDKAKFELPSPAGGVLLKRLALERAVLPVGFVLCVLGAPGEVISPEIEKKNEALLAVHKGMVTNTSAVPTAAIDPAAMGSANAVRATPAARRVAKELNIDLAAVVKALNLSGPVNEKDVRAFTERKA
ncbi:MAG TPA: biotin/lipoyl-containing protein [Planctomycetota bacterium]|nr:biotin/lipoyl-containing protein [Planctomycetota bacterium]